MGVTVKIGNGDEVDCEMLADRDNTYIYSLVARLKKYIILLPCPTCHTMPSVRMKQITFMLIKQMLNAFHRAYIKQLQIKDSLFHQNLRRAAKVP